MSMQSYETSNNFFLHTALVGWAVGHQESGTIIALFEYRLDALLFTEQSSDYFMFRLP